MGKFTLGDYMTLDEAKLILKTYKLPLSNDQLTVYRQALNLVLCFSMKRIIPTEVQDE